MVLQDSRENVFTPPRGEVGRLRGRNEAESWDLHQGGDLRQALSADNDSQLNWWNGGKQIALDIVKGLACLHSRDVIHRDIKSQNILLTWVSLVLSSNSV